MSITALVQCSEELRRLAIAGSGLACGDERLKRLVKPLRRSGKRQAVFTQVADAVEALVDSERNDSAESMLDLGMLVQAILYTQGVYKVTGRATKFKASSTSSPDDFHRIHHSHFKSVFDDLMNGSTAGIRKALAQGVLPDPRLTEWVLYALEDSGKRFGDLLQWEVLRPMGKSLVPFLQDIEVKGKTFDARKLELLCAVDFEAAWPTCQQVLEEGNVKLKLIAIRYMAGQSIAVDSLAEQAASSTSAMVRQAAEYALESQPEISPAEQVDKGERIAEKLDIKQMKRFVEAVTISQDPAITARLIRETENQLAAALAKPKSASLKRLHTLLECFEDRRDHESSNFIGRCFDERDRIATFTGGRAKTKGMDVLKLVFSLVAMMGPASSRKELATGHADIHPELLSFSFLAACQVWKAAKVFDIFSRYFDGSAKLPDAEARASNLRRNLQAGHFDYPDWFEKNPAFRKPGTMDARWFDLAVSMNDAPFIYRFHRMAAKKADFINWVVDVVRTTHDDRLAIENITFLFILGYPKVTDLWIERVTKHLRRESSDSPSSFYFLCLRFLPTDRLAEMQAAIESLPESTRELGMGHLRARHYDDAEGIPGYIGIPRPSKE